MSGPVNLGLGECLLQVPSDVGPTGSNCSMLVYRTYAIGDRQSLPILKDTKILRQCPHFLVMRGDRRVNRSRFFSELSKVKGLWWLPFLPHFLHALQSYCVPSKNFIEDLLIGFLGTNRLSELFELQCFLAQVCNLIC